MNERLLRIKDFSLLTTTEMYTAIQLIRVVCGEREQNYTKALDQLMVASKDYIKEEYNVLVKNSEVVTVFDSAKMMAKEFEAHHGFYIQCSRLYPTDKSRHNVWMRVKKAIVDYYILLNAKVTNTHVTTCDLLADHESDLINMEDGSFHYAQSDQLMWNIHIVRTIRDNFLDH